MAEDDKRDREAAQDNAREERPEKRQQPNSGSMVISPPPAEFETK